MSTGRILRIDLRVARGGARVRAVTIGLQRPDLAPVLIGRTPQEAVERVAHLHATCGAAHRLAALRAVEAARHRCAADTQRSAPAPAGAPASASPLTAAERAVLHEIVLEHLLRLFLDWPIALGQVAQPAVLRDWRRRLQQVDPAIADADIDAVLRQGASLVDAAPSAAGIATRLRRRVRKTAASLMAVKLAARCPGKIRQRLAPRAPASGPWSEGRAATARGTLIHRIGLQRDATGREVVDAWSIDAPTDRLFVDDGPVARALLDLRADGVAALRRLAALCALSFDPCFECRIALHEDGEDDA